MSNVHLPLLLGAGFCRGSHGTARGAYLRWAVREYLGLVGVPPLTDPSTEEHGFRLYHAIRPDVSTPAVPVAFSGPSVTASPMLGDPSMVCYSALAGGDVAIAATVGEPVHATFTYWLSPGQVLRLAYTLRSQDGDDHHEVDLTYPGAPEPGGPPLVVAYGIHADRPNQRLVEMAFHSDRTIVLGEFRFGYDGPFFRWSPGAGDQLWRPVAPTDLLVDSAPFDPVRPVSPDAFLDLVTAFYQRYFGAKGKPIGEERIRFDHPTLPGVGVIDWLLDEYDAGRYRELITQGVPSTNPLAAQQAAALETLRPGAAHALGLFRVVAREDLHQSPRWYKVQGRWAGRRLIAYRSVDPESPLPTPEPPVFAVETVTAWRALHDYRTWRHHYPIRANELRIDDQRTTASTHAVLAQRLGGQLELLAHRPLMPDPTKPDLTHACDRYRGSDVRKVLDGAYTYQLYGFDVFGQASSGSSGTGQVTPIRLRPGEIERLDVLLDATPPGDPAHDPLQPWPVPEGGTTIPLKVSFFWPPAARYVWDRNRATGTPSVVGFRLLGLSGVPLSVPVSGEVAGSDETGLTLALEAVTPDGVNAALYHALRGLEATTPSGELVAADVAVLLTDGNLLAGKRVTIVGASLDSTTILLLLVPDDEREREAMAAAGSYHPTEQFRSDEPIKAQLQWNRQARRPGDGARLGWKPLGPDQLHPAPKGMDGVRPTFSTPTEPVPPDPSRRSYARDGVRYVTPTSDNEIFTVDVPLDVGELADHDRLLLVAKPAGREPGEVPRTNGSHDEVPPEVDPLFLPEEINAFFVTLDRHDDGERIRFRGAGPTVLVPHPDSGDDIDYRAVPDPDHDHWSIIRPTIVTEVRVPSALLLPDGFEGRRQAKVTLNVAVEAVVSDDDLEVEDAIQATIVPKKIVLERIVEPPVVDFTPAPPQRAIAASRPDRLGRSLAWLADLYTGTDVAAELPDAHEYRLHQVPASALIPTDPIEYADVDGHYRRNAHRIVAALAGNDGGSGLAKSAVGRAFESARPCSDWRGKEALLAQPIEIPGDARTMFLHALTARDPVDQVESDLFGLAWPLYAEDRRPPAAPSVISWSLRLSSAGTLAVEAIVKRDLRPPEPGAFDTISRGWLPDDELLAEPFYAGENLPRLTRTYEIYLTNVLGIAHRPDDGDFSAVDGDTSEVPFEPGPPPFTPLTLKLDTTTTAAAGNTVIVTASAALVGVPLPTAFASGAGQTTIDALLPTVFAGLRATNHLGERSDLRLAPHRLEHSG